MSVDRSKSSECGGKQQHATKQAAVDHRASLARNGAPHWRLSVYRCQHCRAWHVGHHPRPKKNRR